MTCDFMLIISDLRKIHSKKPRTHWSAVCRAYRYKLISELWEMLIQTDDKAQETRSSSNYCKFVFLAFDSNQIHASKQKKI